MYIKLYGNVKVDILGKFKTYSQGTFVTACKMFSHIACNV